MLTQPRRPRLLLVCYANSAHALPWISLLDGSEFDVRVFSTPLREEEQNTRNWDYPTYITVKPERGVYPAKTIYSLLPGWPVRGISNLIDQKFSMTKRWLRWIIQTWKPDILHSMPLDVGGKLAAQALRAMPHSKWPKWIVSAWGNDLHLGWNQPKEQPNLKYIIQNCDGFFADCQRDLDMAVKVGLASSKLSLPHPMPGPGGLQLEIFANIRRADSQRNIILVPKAFERLSASGNRTLPILEAFLMLEDQLSEYEIHLVSCSSQVRNYLSQLPDWLKARCHCYDGLPQNELFALMGRSRVVIAPSLSDGTPNVMLEAMAAGALPIMSSIESIKEWITYGENGLLAHALYPDKIAVALRRALTDDALFEQAGCLNWEIVQQRADRQKVRTQVLAYYRGLIG